MQDSNRRRLVWGSWNRQCSHTSTHPRSSSSHSDIYLPRVFRFFRIERRLTLRHYGNSALSRLSGTRISRTTGRATGAYYRTFRISRVTVTFSNFGEYKSSHQQVTDIFDYKVRTPKESWAQGTCSFHPSRQILDTVSKGSCIRIRKLETDSYRSGLESIQKEQAAIASSRLKGVKDTELDKCY